MDSFATYGNSGISGLNQQSEPGAVSADSVFTTTSAQNATNVPIDSSKLTTNDSTFYFWQNQAERKDIKENSQFQGDTSYVAKIMWHDLKMTTRQKDYAEGDWLTIVIFIAFALLASVGAGYSKYIGSLYQSLINYPTSFRMFREKNYSILHGAFRLESLYYIVFSIFISQVISLISTGTIFFTLIFYAKTLAVVVLYFLAKKMAYLALGSIFIDTSDTKEFIFNMDNFNRGVGIVLFPVVALIAYYPSENPMVAIFMGILATSVFYVMLLKRGISILLKKQFPIFYLFLYLCTLEILPLLLMYKIVVD